MLAAVMGDRGDKALVQRAVEIGKTAGEAVWRGRLNDGMNHSGAMFSSVSESGLYG